MNRTIHAIWLGPSMTPLSLICLHDWKKQGYTYKLWTEDNPLVIKWINGCKFAKECYSRKLFAFVTDYLRLKILQHEGGLYLDTDVTIQQDPFLLFDNIDFSVGYENETMLGTAIIFATKESKILTELINFYENDILNSPLYMGPGILTHFLIKKNVTKLEHSVIYPVNYFYSYQGEGSDVELSSNSYLIHWFQHSWKDPKKTIYLKSKHMGLWGKLYTWQKYIFRKRKNDIYI